jgi:hypothetical protein
MKNERNLTMNTTATQPPIVSRAATVNTVPYWQGFDAYCQGHPLEGMPTEEHARGWWAANRAEGETLEYIEYQGETDFIRTGGN